MVLGVSLEVLACPSSLHLDQMNPHIRGPRSTIRLFAFSDSGAEGSSLNKPLELAVQVDPTDDGGMLAFFPDESWRQLPLQKSDIVSFRPEDFGRRIDGGKDILPCRGPVTYELKDPATNRYAYLTTCSQMPDSENNNFPINFDGKNHRIQSQRYFYRFNPDNYMQFNEIGFASRTQNQPANVQWETVAEKSQLLIRADVKNFFNLNFDSDEIESELENMRLGPVGHLARLSFYLRVLLFKIRMSLSTDVAFYEDSGHIPMMVTLPVDAFSHLNPTSGILYSWIPAGEARVSPEDIRMPRLDSAIVKKGAKHLAALGLSFCRNSKCMFSYGVNIKGRRLSMDFEIDRTLVAKGFFPLYVDDISRYRETMSWRIDLQKEASRKGLYFEVSGLPKGGHPWDFWLRLGDLVAGAQTCPAPLELSRYPSRS